MTATFAVLFGVLLWRFKILLFLVFLSIFLTGFRIRKKGSFWKWSAAFFASMGLLFMFPMFGGLEANTPGIVSTGTWTKPEALLFAMCVLSMLMAFVAGFRDSRIR